MLATAASGSLKPLPMAGMLLTAVIMWNLVSWTNEKIQARNQEKRSGSGS
jgi:hypothetical protein